jgi:hypothetical protein
MTTFPRLSFTSFAPSVLSISRGSTNPKALHSGMTNARVLNGLPMLETLSCWR